MLFTTTTQLVVLALVLIAGWFFGLASHSGGRKWQARYADERDAHAATRRDADQRYVELERRHAELDREHARLAQAAPVTAATVTPAATVPVEPIARPAASASPAYPQRTVLGGPDGTVRE